jgi:hypothetical protein
MAALLVLAALIEATLFLTAWTPAAARFWSHGAPRLVAGCGHALCVAALVAFLVLPVVGAHWPGLLRGPRWRAAAILGYSLFALAVFVQELTWHGGPQSAVANGVWQGAASGTPSGALPAWQATWSPETELRGDALLRLLILALALPILFAARKRADAPPTDGSAIPPD